MVLTMVLAFSASQNSPVALRSSGVKVNRLDIDHKTYILKSLEKLKEVLDVFRFAGLSPCPEKRAGQA